MIRLSVSYNEREEVKRYGARWNPRERFWFYPGTALPPELEKWRLKKSVPPGSEEKGAPDEPPLLSEKQLPGEEDFLSVSRLCRRIQEHFYTSDEFRGLLVKGEITGFNDKSLQDGSSHLYFSIKDEEALLNVFMSREEVRTGLRAAVQNGKAVLIRGSLDHYAGQGRTQLRAESLQELGEGLASLALQKLKEKLEKEGLFSPEWKKPIPKYPRSIGIVTSPKGQAIQDICQVAKKRNPYVQLILYPVAVQGALAVKTTVAGIRRLDAYGVDTIIVGRGGGSEEELSVYNDEALVRAVFAAKTPVVSAVGHAGNWCLTDLAADKRVATPTEAAEETVPDVMAEIRRLGALRRESRAAIARHTAMTKTRLAREEALLRARHPRRLLEQRKERLAELREENRRQMGLALLNKQERRQKLKADLSRLINGLLSRKQHRLELALARLHGLSPTAKLVKGFGYISREGKAVTTVEGLQKGDSLDIRIHDGQIQTRVEEISRREEHE